MPNILLYDALSKFEIALRAFLAVITDPVASRDTGSKFVVGPDAQSKEHLPQIVGFGAPEPPTALGAVHSYNTLIGTVRIYANSRENCISLAVLVDTRFNAADLSISGYTLFRADEFAEYEELTKNEDEGYWMTEARYRFNVNHF